MNFYYILKTRKLTTGCKFPAKLTPWEDLIKIMCVCGREPLWKTRITLRKLEKNKPRQGPGSLSYPVISRLHFASTERTMEGCGKYILSRFS